LDYSFTYDDYCEFYNRNLTDYFRAPEYAYGNNVNYIPLTEKTADLTEVLIQLKILSLPIDILGEIIGDKSVAECIVLGLFECTRALKSLAISKFNAFTLPIASAVCGFGGLSVIIQSIAYLKNAKIKTAPFILAKIISAVLNFIFGIIISLIIF